MSRINVRPAMLRYTDARLGCLCEAGFSFEMVDRAWNTIDSHIYGFTLQKLNFPIDESEYVKAAKEHVQSIPADKYPYMNRMTHYLIDGHYDGVVDFSFGLELILNGLEVILNKA